MQPERPLRRPPITVIHVGNDKTQLQLTKLLLEDADPRINIITASTYEELLEKLPTPHDCVLSDIHMPGIDEIRLCTLLKQSDDTPFILYTNKGREEVAEKAFSSGADDYITKEMNPRHIQFLAKRITQIVEKHRTENTPLLNRKRLEALHIYTADIASATSLDEAAEHLFKAIQGTLGSSHVGLHLIEEGRLVQRYPLRPSLPESPVQELDGASVTVRAVKKAETQVVPDTRLDEGYKEEGVNTRPLSEVAVPFKINGVVAGVIDVKSEKLYAFSEEDVRLLEVLAPHIASAVSRLTQDNQYRMSEEEWRSILEASMDAAIIIQSEEIVYANRRCAELLGYGDPIRLVGLNPLSLVAPRDRGKAQEWMTRRQRGGNPLYRFELSLLKEDSAEVTVETNVAPIEYKGAAATLWFCRDITKRIQYQKKLSALHVCAVRMGKAKDEDEACGIILDSVKTVLGFDFAGIALKEERNLRYKKCLGVPLVGDWLIPVNGRSVTTRAYRTGARQVVPDTRDEPDYLRPPVSQGLYEALSELAVPISEADAVIGVINVESRDLDAFTDHDAALIETLAMHAASALRRIREKRSLEELVKDHADRLLEAERFSARGKIAAMVAHDLRGPLQNISNSAYILRNRLGQDRDVARIGDAVCFAARVLEELKNDTTNIPLCPVTCNLVDLIRTTIESLNRPSGIRVEFTHDNVGPVNVDPVKMRRVLNNLIINSMEAMEGCGVVTVKLTHNESLLYLEVCDTGPGIPGDLMPRLFSEVVTTKTTGHGLGLQYCSRVVALHGGRIYADPNYGDGARIVVELPSAAEEKRKSSRCVWNRGNGVLHKVSGDAGCVSDRSSRGSENGERG